MSCWSKLGTPNRSGARRAEPFASRTARARVAEPSCLEPLERDEPDDDDGALEVAIGVMDPGARSVTFDGWRLSQ
jgi:hypothetical protein